MKELLFCASVMSLWIFPAYSYRIDGARENDRVPQRKKRQGVRKFGLLEFDETSPAMTGMMLTSAPSGAMISEIYLS